MTSSRAEWLMHLQRHGPSEWPVDRYRQPCEDCLALGWTRATVARSARADQSLHTIYTLTTEGREAVRSHCVS